MKKYPFKNMHNSIKFFSISIIIFFIAVFSGCAPSAAAIERALEKTRIAMPPTYTPYPTYTALPTYTPPPSVNTQITPSPIHLNPLMPGYLTQKAIKMATVNMMTTQTLATHKTQIAILTKTTTLPKTPYASQTATLKLEITVKVFNNCDHVVSLKLIGPMTVELIAKPGETAERQLPRGTYTTIDSEGNTWDQTLDVHVWHIEYCN